MFPPIRQLKGAEKEKESSSILPLITKTVVSKPETKTKGIVPQEERNSDFCIKGDRFPPRGALQNQPFHLSKIFTPRADPNLLSTTILSDLEEN